MKAEPPAAAESLEDEISALVRKLHDTQERLRELTGGQVDAVLHPGGQSYLLPEAQDKLRQSEMTQRDYAATKSSILNALPAHIALINHAGVIISVNEGWLRFAGSNALESSARGVGDNYLQACEQAHGPGAPEAHAAAAGIRAVLTRTQPAFGMEYPCLSATGKHWYRLRVNPMETDGQDGAVVMHVEITEQKQSEQKIQRLNRLHTVLSQTGEAVVRTKDRLALYEAVCRIVVESGGLRMALIVEIDAESGQARQIAVQGEGQDYFSLQTVTTDGGPLSRGTIGTTLRTGIGDYCNDFAHDPRMEPWRESASQYGFRATASFPLKMEGATIGALVLFAGETGYFQDDEIGLMTAVTEDVSFALDALQKAHQRERMERDLRASEANLAAAQRIAHFGSWELSFPQEDLWADNTLRWSDEMFRIAGHEPGEFGIHRTAFYRLVHPDDREAIRQELEAALRERREYSIVHRLVRPTGEERIVREKGQILFDAKTGRAVKMIGTTHDITEQRQAEEALQRSEREQRELAQQLEIERARLVAAQAVAKVGSWETDISALSVLWSAETHRIFATDPLVFQPTHAAFLDRVHPEDRALVDEAFVQSLGEQAARSLEHRLLLAGGAIKFVEERWQVFRDEHGQPVRAVGTCQDITERKQIEAEVRRTTELLRVVADGTPDAVFIKDLQGRYLLFNQAAAEFVGRSVAEVLGKDDTSLFPPEDARRVMENDRSVFESRQVETSEEVLTAAGVTRTYLATKAPYLDAEGNVLGLIGISRDITERKHSETALRLSEERFRLLAKATNDAIWDWDMLSNTVWWNEGVEVLFGYSRQEIEPNLESWTTRIHPEDCGRVRENLREVVNQGQTTFADEYRFRRADGSYAFVLGRGQIIRDANGRPIRAVNALTDLTDRIEAERRIAEQAALIDQARDAIFVRDLDNRIVFWNRAAERIYGWTAAEAAGRRYDELLQTDAEKLEQAEAELLTNGEWTGELQKLTKTGTSVTVDCRWTLLRDSQQQPESFLHIDTDITERKKLEEQFLRAQRMESVGTLAGGIAHDLNNVLGPILLALDLFKMRFPDAQSAELIDIIASSATRGADMVRQVLSFARGVEGRRLELRVHDLLSDIKKIADDTFLKHIEIRTTLPDGLWPVVGDPTQLHQVLLNLCVNARDAMPNGGTLTLSAENIVIDQHYAGLNLEAKPGSYVAIHVEDTGMGMPPEVLAKIFEPFYTTKDLGRGTGLGLSTSMAIVKSHGGFIHVYSEPGRGTKFRVYLLAQTEPTSQKADVQETEIPRGNGEMILVIDDESTVRNITHQTLEAFGYRTMVAADGADAVALYAKRGTEIAAVLTDMMMPGIDGPATIQVLRKMNPTLPIIAASGLSTDAQVSKAKDLGVKHFLSKPYTAEALLKILRQVLHEKS